MSADRQPTRPVKVATISPIEGKRYARMLDQERSRELAILAALLGDDCDTRWVA